MKNIIIDKENKETAEVQELFVAPVFIEAIQNGMKIIRSVNNMDRNILKNTEEAQWAEMISWRVFEPKPLSKMKLKWQWAQNLVKKYIHL